MYVSIMRSVQVAYSIPIGSDRASCVIALWNGRGDDVAWTLHPQDGALSRLCLCYLCSVTRLTFLLSSYGPLQRSFF